jgi:hypothetical protein
MKWEALWLWTVAQNRPRRLLKQRRRKTRTGKLQS